MPKKNSPLTATALLVSLSFVKPALGVILLPLYLNTLSLAEYGLYTLMVAVSGIVNIFCTLRVNSAMVPFYFDYNHDDKLLHKYLGQLFSFSIVLGFLFFFITLIIGPASFGLIFNDPSVIFYPYGAIVMATGVLQAINSVYFVYLKNSKLFTKLSIILISQILLSVAIQVVLILILKVGVVGLLIGVLVPYIFTTIWIIFHVSGILDFKFNGAMLKPSLRYSIALLPFLLVFWFNSKGDRIVLEQYLSLDEVGKYALLMTISGILLLVADSVLNGIRPFLYEYFQKGREKFKRNIDLLVKFFVSMNILAAGGILLIGGNLHFITDEESFLSVIPYFTLASIFVYSRSYLVLFNAQLNFTKSSRTISFFSIISFITLIVLFHFFAERYGLEGILYAGIVVGIVTAFAFFIAAQRIYTIDYNLIDLFLIPIVVFVLIYFIPKTSFIPLRFQSLFQFICSVIGVLFILRGNFALILQYIKRELKPG